MRFLLLVWLCASIRTHDTQPTAVVYTIFLFVYFFFSNQNTINSHTLVALNRLSLWISGKRTHKMTVRASHFMNYSCNFSSKNFWHVWCVFFSSVLCLERATEEQQQRITNSNPSNRSHPQQVNEWKISTIHPFVLRSSFSMPRIGCGWSSFQFLILFILLLFL